MSKKANKTAIGAFVIGAVVLLIVAIVVLGSGFLFQRSDKYVLFFDGSVKGLNVGAPVIFKGVKIGNISDISLIYNPKTKDVLIPVVIDVELARVKGVPEDLGYPDYSLLIQQGLRARLEIENFITGQLMLAFDFYPEKPAKFYDLTKRYPELPALPISPDIFEIMNEIPLKDISNNLDQTVAGINKLVNSEAFYQLGRAVQEVTQAAKAIRLFVNYLELHPEALLKGKPIQKDAE
ncbi:MAG: MlaD family protein [Candidatus Omnitrophota bacterium]